MFRTKIFYMCVYGFQREQRNNSRDSAEKNQCVTCLVVLFIIMSGLLKLKAVSSLRSDVWDHFEKKRKPQSANIVIESYPFVAAQQIYEIIYYKIMQKNIRQRKTAMKANVRLTNLY